MAPSKKAAYTRKATPKKKSTNRKASARKKTPSCSTEVKREQRGPGTPPAVPSLDKYELSPTSQAKCKACKRKIMKGTRRVGLETSSPRFGVYHMYYHEECLPASAKKNLRLGGATPQQLISHQLQQANESKTILRLHAALRENLRLLRSLFAKRLNYAAFCICKDETLDELVVKMPRTKAEFLAIRGMGPKKFQSFGGPFMRAIADYRATLNYKQATRSSKQRAVDSKLRAKAPEVIDLVGESTSLPKRRPEIYAPVRTADDDDPIVLETSLTMEQIVEEKFKHAQENGYVISVDL